ncbi:MAG: CopY family transcriptional regulator [Nonomuraea muscovyensis]|nr:CopY family transcriptional regulator [Nonomuraea muscovyensis]
MDILWAQSGALTAREVGKLIADRDLAPTTIMTVLDRLTRKGFLERTRDGRAWRYAPAATRDAYVAELMLEALDMTGDRSAALTRFAQAVSGREAEILRRALTELEDE